MRISSYIVLAAVAAAACGGDQDTSGRTVLGAADSVPGVPAEVRVHLDSGTAAYRAGDYEAARAHYGKATEADPHVAAGWLGVAMAARALGDTVAADSALVQAQQMAPGLIMEHPEPGSGGMPQGHPAMPGDSDAAMPPAHPPIEGQR
ncbi:MAG TPA: hypothetical protein VMK65_04745 [Longimicrobiales bacterium]|nr:hypothetical protein [Longimicrobiales bacterium]